MQTFLDAKLLKRKSSLSDLMLNGLICDRLTNAELRAKIATNYRFAGLKVKTIMLRLSDNANQLVAEFAEEQNLRKSEAGYCILADVLSGNAEEAWYQLKLAADLDGKREITVPCGRIDVLTDQLVIEVKTAKQYKHAIGQVLCYQLYKPTKRPAIALFGRLNAKEQATVRKCCNQLGIELIWM